jgi:hypothetical protein
MDSEILKKISERRTVATNQVFKKFSAPFAKSITRHAQHHETHSFCQLQIVVNHSALLTKDNHLGSDDLSLRESDVATFWRAVPVQDSSMLRIFNSLEVSHLNYFLELPILKRHQIEQH